MPVTIENIRNMERYTRDLIRAYSQFHITDEMKKTVETDNCNNNCLIKQFAQKHKTHRCSDEQEYEVVREMMT